MRKTFNISDPDFDKKVRALIGNSEHDHLFTYSEYLEATYALRAIKHHQKEISEHKKLIKDEVNIVRKLVKRLEKV